MVATTRARSSGPTATARRSCVDDSLVVENELKRARRHSVAAIATTLTEVVPSQLTSPRTLKEYEAQLQQKRESERDVQVVRPGQLTKRPSSSLEDSDLLPRKILLTTRPVWRGAPPSAEELPSSELGVIGPPHAEIHATVADITEGFKARVGPVPVDDGTGGVYYLRSRAQRIVGVFKPADEEPFAINNPKEHRPRRNSRSVHSNNGDDGSTTSPEQMLGIRGGIAPGGAAVREVAAFLLDHEHRAGVPPTAIVAARHPTFFVRSKASTPHQRKIGSLQIYVPHDCTADDLSESVIPVDRVHALAILDIRMANQDRHGGNVLVVGSRESGCYDIVPIDHGACLPRITSMDETTFLWHWWPQAKKPFGTEATAYIASLNGIQDAERLIAQLPTTHQIEPDALLTLVICTELLQICVLKFGMTAFDIASLMCRPDPSEPSGLEQILLAGLGHEKQSTMWSRRAAETLVHAFRLRLEQFLRRSFGH